jgi:Bifunctional DNA primase/polymerase, N-terminal
MPRLAMPRSGWSVFPVPAGTKQSHKCARRSGGRNWGATRDPEEIRRDFTRWPKAGIAIPTGDNGIVVIETDTKVGGHAHDGEPELVKLIKKYGPLPPGPVAESPTGSKHRYFLHPGSGVEIVSKNHAPGIDVKANNGMVVTPPTERSGVGFYRWIISPHEMPIPSLPLRWARALSRQPAPPYVPPPRTSSPLPSNGYGVVALESEIAKLEMAADGNRNHQLNASSYSLYQLVSGGYLTDGEVDRRLVAACVVNGLMDDRENGGFARIRKTIESGARAGLRKPRGPK